ncbi:MAG: glycosyltransferase family 2 protein [Candidatus Gastranaerophilales bacterium]|nr:glycosyltransferase family 2 protein [Candidatus Gastranaerophilales bacterium]
MHFSIITASYNYEDYIKETIESVINQTYSNWEMIIIDDGSKDNSVEVIQEYCKKDSRIKLLTHENHKNKGLIETIKLGIKNANNDWIVFLESDDTLASNYLEKN